MVHASAKYNSEDNLLEDIKPLAAEFMKMKNFLKIRRIRQVRRIRWIRVCIRRIRVLKIA